MGSGCPWDFRIGPGVENERTHLRDMLGGLPAAATLVADAGFSGYDLLTAILGGGRHILFRVGNNVRLLQKLGYARIEADSTVYLWPEKLQPRNTRPLVLRLIVLQDEGRPVYLVTDMDDQALSLEQASVLYRLRWGIEVFYRTLKQTLRHRKMRSGAPQQAQRELQWAMAGLWVLSVRGTQAVVAAGKNPRGLSIALARKRLRQAMAGRCRARTDLGRRLGGALKDAYKRHGSKMARDWPHKKNPSPAGKPKIRTATPKEVTLAKGLQQTDLAA
jgi:IS4 transposase